MNIIELAKEAGFEVDEGLFPFEATEDKFIGTEHALERFAALVREQTLKDDKDLLTAYLVGFKAGQEERKWVDLTCEEVTALIREGAADGGWQGFATRVQTAFKEKNK